MFFILPWHLIKKAEDLARLLILEKLVLLARGLNLYLPDLHTVVRLKPPNKFI